MNSNRFIFVSTFVIALSSIAAVVVLGVVVHEQNKSPVRVVFVVPAHYQGILKLHVQKNKRHTIKPDGGTYRFVFPDSGVLKLQGQLAVWDFSHLVVRTKGGKPIPVATQVQVDANVVALRNLGTYSLKGNIRAKEAWYVIGTKQDQAQAFADKYGDDYDQ